MLLIKFVLVNTFFTKSIVWSSRVGETKTFWSSKIKKTRIYIKKKCFFSRHPYYLRLFWPNLRGNNCCLMNFYNVWNVINSNPKIESSIMQKYAENLSKYGIIYRTHLKTNYYVTQRLYTTSQNLSVLLSRVSINAWAMVLIMILIDEQNTSIIVENNKKNLFITHLFRVLKGLNV